MIFEQGAIIAILLGMLVAYATERFRIEVVAMCGLAAGFATGAVPVTAVFSGFASPAVITVIEILLVVTALVDTHTLDGFARGIVMRLRSETGVLVFLCLTGAGVSVFMNNIGALALMFPVALSVCKRLGIAPARVLMPLSFATLLGGMCSLTGTPANLVVNEWMVGETGRNLGYFELAVVGGPLTLIGIAWLVLGAPRVFSRFANVGGDVPDAGPTEFVAECTIAGVSPLVGLGLAEFERRTGLHAHAVLRQGAHVFARRPDIVIAANDELLIEGSITRIYELAETGELVLAGNGGRQPDSEILELVVMPDSLLLGSRIDDIAAYSGRDAWAVALASRRGRIEGRFADLPISMGDVIVMSGDREVIRRLAAECGLLALSQRRIANGRRNAISAVAMFGVGVLATALELVPTEIAFGAVVLALALTGRLNLRTALQEVNWGIVILLACMIPLGIALEKTGTAHLIADQLADVLPIGEPLVVVLAILALAVGITPFVDNVSTAALLSPIAAGLATRTGTPVEPLLMAVAVGASLDFLTPFGHHNNAVVMGAGGYRFMDFPRLGAPLTALCLAGAVGVFALMLVR